MYYVLEVSNQAFNVNQKQIGFVKGFHHSKWKALDQRDHLEQCKLKWSVMNYIITSVTQGNRRYDLRA